MTKTIDILSLDELAGVTGGGNAPLGGNVRQNINTNWGGAQTNINTQIVNPLPPPNPATRVDYLRAHPEARWAAPPYKPRPVGGWH